MRDSGHLEHAELVEYLDGELSERQAESVRLHMAGCAACRAECDQLTSLSVRIRELVAAAPLAEENPAGRIHLLKNLEAPARSRNPGLVMRRFGWGMALAASVAIALIMIPKRTPVVPSQTVSQSAPKAQLASLDVNGESFVALPYSDPDLPLNAPRIVEMQVPVSSLTAAGIALDQVSDGSPDRTVRANVLLGMDGQPLGLHVLNAE